MKMRFMLPLLLLATFAHAEDVCIRDPDIKATEVVDDSHILFHMRDHKTWVNTLQINCLGLRNEPYGFSYQPTDPTTQELCSNQVLIRLNTRNTFCELGNFTRVK
jgi:hypothetical protein